MALKAPKQETATAPDQAVNVAPEETTNETTSNGENGAESNGKTRGERNPWTDEEVRAVKTAVRDNPGIDFEVLLSQLRDGFLSSRLEGDVGRRQLITKLKAIRAAEAKAAAAGKEFTPMPEVVMPVEVKRPNLLAW